MKIISIEEKTYSRMKQAFEDFVHSVEELCQQPDVSQKWLTGEEVCLLLDIQKRTLQYYRDSGKLPFSVIGNKCYYKVSDVEKLINDSYVK